MLPQLDTFENAVFGPDFAIAPEDTEAWAESGCWFCATVTGQAVVGRRQILSMVSVLVTTIKSRDHLLAGNAAEGQLQAWANDSLNEDPALYLVSVISAAPTHLRLMYDSLSRDLREFKSTWRANFHSGFAIACGPAGFNHMARNGFRPFESRQYRGHYPLMVIDSQSAATRFWREVLSREPLALQRNSREQAIPFVRARAGIAG